MRIEEIREKTTTELHDLLAENRRLLSDLKFRHSYEGIDNPMRIRELRRTIARILTVINERRIEEEIKSGKRKNRRKK